MGGGEEGNVVGGERAGEGGRCEGRGGGRVRREELHSFTPHIQ